ncbi:MAG: S9 family peptidase [Acidobacteriota bacterium]
MSRCRWFVGVFIVSCGLVVPAVSGGDDLESSAARLAKVGACWSPSFSPDGRQLSFVSNLTGVPQVWTVSVEGGWPRRVTALDDAVGGVTWSPAGKWLAFSLAPGGGMNQQVYLIHPDGTKLRRLTDGGRENNWLGEWNHEGTSLTISSNRAGPRSMDAYIYDMRDRDLDLKVKNPGIGSLTEISRDGRRAVVWRMKSRSDTNLYLVDLDSGEEKLLTPHDPPGNFSGGRFSPDGDIVYLSSDEGHDHIGFARVRIGADGSPGPVETIATHEEAELQEFAISPDGRTAALAWNDAGRSLLEFQDLETLKIQAGPTLPAEIATDLTFSRDGASLAMSISGAAAPPDIWVLQRATGLLRQVTFSPHPGVDLDRLVRPQLVRFKAHDGLRLSGWLYLPRRAGGPGPLVLSFHGGPEGQERPRFRGDYQALLARGIAVFAPNVRGSSGFGKRFVNLDNGALRFEAVKDIRDCIDYVVSAGIADPDRIGIMGGSYGGYMTMAGLTEYPGLFAAGADLFGVVNFETFFEQTEPWMAAISTIEYGDPATQKDLLRRLSPIHKIDRVKAPTLILHGANDTNVPVVEAEQVAKSLEQNDVPVEYILFPDEGHGFRKEANRIRTTVALVKWFEKYL